MMIPCKPYYINLIPNGARVFIQRFQLMRWKFKPIFSFKYLFNSVFQKLPTFHLVRERVFLSMSFGTQIRRLWNYLKDRICKEWLDISASICWSSLIIFDEYLKTLCWSAILKGLLLLNMYFCLYFLEYNFMKVEEELKISI